MSNNTVKKTGFVLFWIAQLFVVTSVSGATATFTPVGSTTVALGTNIVFEVTVSVATLPEFNTADILVGSDAATDIAFAYSAEWTAAFANVTTPAFDTGTYAQDIFVGGNNSTVVGTSLLLGTVTVITNGMSTGTFNVTINNSIDGVSTLGLAGEPEAINGSAEFTVTVPVPAASEWGLTAMMLSLLIVGTLLVREKSLHAK